MEVLMVSQLVNLFQLLCHQSLPTFRQLRERVEVLDCLKMPVWFAANALQPGFVCHHLGQIADRPVLLDVVEKSRLSASQLPKSRRRLLVTLCSLRSATGSGHCCGQDGCA
jgi:hypothetical protein